MKIAFVDFAKLAYDAATPFEQPLGGTQSAICYLAAALARLGHEVTIFNAATSERCVLDVTVRPSLKSENCRDYNAFDVIIVPTYLPGVKLRSHGVSAPLVSWQHQSTQSSKGKAMSAPGEPAAWDRIVFVSEHQRSQFRQAFGVDGVVLKNAPAPAFAALGPRSRYFFEDHRPPRFLYCSAPGRGLDFLLFAFPTIRARLPEATLAVYSDQKIYQIGPDDDDFSVYYETARSLPGVEYFGSVPQPGLADAMLEADFWLYPTNFIETSCIAMMEAGCAGLGLITSDAGALPETSASYATTLGLPGTRSGWSKVFAEAAIDRVQAACADPTAARAFLEKQSRHFRSATWDHRAAEWVAMLSPLAVRAAKDRGVDDMASPVQAGVTLS